MVRVVAAVVVRPGEPGHGDLLPMGDAPQPAPHSVGGRQIMARYSPDFNGAAPAA